jgi:hypothetical protein
MDEVSAGSQAADRLLAGKEALAGAVIEALYAERPGLVARYGPVGREKCLQDMHYTLEHLIPAVELDRPAMFADYTVWLGRLLRARSVATEDVLRSLELMEDVVRARLPADEAAVVGPILRAGVVALRADGGP